MKASDVDSIVIHCSATPEGADFRAKDIDRWHKDRGFQMIGYHYVIDLDGTIEKGRPTTMNGAHCNTSGLSGRPYNSHSIGICYIGGCNKHMYAQDTRTPQQKESLYKLVHKLLDEYGLTLNAVYCHNQFHKYKACPSFKIDDFKKEYTQYYEQEKNDK